VALVRAALKGFGTLLNIERELLDDLQMVASEACNNVVRHAYRGGEGPLRFAVAATPSSVELIVRDSGEWTNADTDDDEQTGLGLAVINALADYTKVTRLPEGGTEVSMRFACAIPVLETWPGATPEAAPAPRGANPPHPGPVSLPGDVVATVSPVSLLPGVLGRLARALAANARFSVERFADIHVVVDSLVGHAQRWASNGRISFALGSEVRRLSFRLAPLRQGASELTAISCGESQRRRLSKLVDELEFEPRPGSEVLSLTFTERGLAHAI
jgi:serine/threonine-protein kinase RsbW